MTLSFRAMAEREGFEPSIEFPLYTLSKRAPSTTRPSLRLGKSARLLFRITRSSRALKYLLVPTSLVSRRSFLACTAAAGAIACGPRKAPRFFGLCLVANRDG